MKNKKGFTLVELLVVIVILGIVTAISIPVIRNVQSSMTKKKYTTYYDSLKSSAKLYNDTYSEDYLGNSENGVYCVDFEELEKRKLIKDINIENVTCNKKGTFVRVTKLEDKYIYTPYLECGEQKEGEASDVIIPDPLESDSEVSSKFCQIEGHATIIITADQSQVSTVYDKKRKRTKVTISSVTGIHNKINIKGQWVKEGQNADPQNFETITFTVGKNQKETILKDGAVSTTSGEIVTPKGADGHYYLVLEINRLVDLYGSPWTNPKPEDGKYVKFGPFSVDNTPPTCPIITTKSNNKTYTPGTWTNKNIDFKFKFDNDTNNWDWCTNNTTTGKYTNHGNNPKTETAKSITGEGKRHIRLYVYDLAKNVRECKYDTVDYNIDKTPPTCGKPNGASTTWVNTNRTIKQPCTDSLSGCVKNSYDKTYSATKKIDKVTIKDKANNTKDCTYNVYVDKTPPSCGNATGSSTNWTNANRTIKQACVDTDSTCVKTSYDKTYSSSKTNDTVTIKDKAGNIKNCSYNVYVDKDKPTCTKVAKISNASGSDYSNNALTCSNVYTNATCSDTGGSGCSKKTITTTGATQNVADSSSYSQWTVEARGTSYLTWKVYDKAGNSTSCSKITVKKGTESASSACGCASYNSCSACGCASYKYCKSASCGTEYYTSYIASPTAESCTQRSKGRIVANSYCRMPGSGSGSNCCCAVTKSRNKSCYSASCGCASYNSCSSCGCASYKTCCHE